MIRAAQNACREAHITPAAINLVVTGAAGGQVAAWESEALATLFAGTRSVFMTAPKGLVGEGFAFTSAMQIALGALALSEQVVPPSEGGPTSRDDLPVILDRPERHRLDHALIVSTNATGSASAVVLGRSRRR